MRKIPKCFLKTNGQKSKLVQTYTSYHNLSANKPISLSKTNALYNLKSFQFSKKFQFYKDINDHELMKIFYKFRNIQIKLPSFSSIKIQNITKQFKQNRKQFVKRKIIRQQVSSNNIENNNENEIQSNMSIEKHVKKL